MYVDDVTAELEPSKKVAAKKRATSKRELIDTGTAKRFVKREEGSTCRLTLGTHSPVIGARRRGIQRAAGGQRSATTTSAIRVTFVGTGCDVRLLVPVAALIDLHERPVPEDLLSEVLHDRWVTCSAAARPGSGTQSSISTSAPDSRTG
jgi:hypothetical protein